MREALITYEGNYAGLAQTKRLENLLVLVYRPQEVVAALQHLGETYDEYFTTVAEYNRAQFELYHALGYPAQELACNAPPGEPMPVETVRPSYLPPVASGPPRPPAKGASGTPPPVSPQRQLGTNTLAGAAG